MSWLPKDNLLNFIGGNEVGGLLGGAPDLKRWPFSLTEFRERKDFAAGSVVTGSLLKFLKVS